MWTLDFIAPNILCTTQGGVCIPTSYPIPKGAVKIEADGNGPDEQQPPKQDPATKLQYLKGPVSDYILLCSLIKQKDIFTVKCMA